MSKRGRESESDVQVFSPSCYIHLLPTSLLTHLLAFVWNHTYRLALVDKRFLAITRSRAFWRLLGQHALKGVLPNYVLEQVDFFYGLKPKHGPHGWLWGLLHKDKPNEPFRSHHIIKDEPIFKRQNSEKCLSITVTESERPEFHLLFYLTRSSNLFFGQQDMITRIIFNNPLYRKDIYMVLDNRRSVFFYVEYWDIDKTRLWCGAIKDNPAEEEWYPLEPFGRWIDAKDVVD